MIRDRWYRELDRWGHLCLMLWHIHTRAYPHPCMLALALTHARRQSILPRDVLDIRVWVSPTFNLVSSYSGVLLRVDSESDSRYLLTQRVCTLGYTLDVVRFTCSDDWVFGDVFQSFYWDIWASDVHTRAYPHQFFYGYWMLWIRVEGFSSGMDVCDISSFLTLTLCALVGFWPSIDALD